MSQSLDEAQAEIQRLRAELNHERNLRLSRRQVKAKACPDAKGNPEEKNRGWDPSDGVVQWRLEQTSVVYQRILANHPKSEWKHSFPPIAFGRSYLFDALRASEEINALLDSLNPDLPDFDPHTAVALLAQTRARRRLVEVNMEGVLKMLTKRHDLIAVKVYAQQAGATEEEKLLSEKLDARSNTDMTMSGITDPEILADFEKVRVAMLKGKSKVLGESSPRKGGG